MAALAVLATIAGSARADTVWSLSPSEFGDWSVASNWDNGIPVFGETTQVVNGGTAMITSSDAICGDLTVGSSIGSGTIQMTGGTLRTWSTYIGDVGTGTFTQSGGASEIYWLHVGYEPGGHGTYNLSGTGELSVHTMNIGSNAGEGVFVQSGGICEVTSSCQLTDGTYDISGTGQLLSQNAYLRGGTFTQSGGVHTVSMSLYVGSQWGSGIVYNLSGGQLSAAKEYIGADDTTDLFCQTGGTNTTPYLAIRNGGRYVFSGGTLEITGGFSNQGTFDGDGRSFALDFDNCIVDFTDGTFANVGSVTLTLGANCLLIAHDSFDSSVFAKYTSQAIVHTPGTTLTVLPGQTVTGAGSIKDLVACQGAITATTGGFIDLNNGLTLSQNGSVNLGTGNLTVNDAISGMTGGSLVGFQQLIGSNGTGTFTQSGGTSSIVSLTLGRLRGDTGNYVLSGGTMILNNLEVGSSGTGTFVQSGGTNSLDLSGVLNVGLSGTGTYYLIDGFLSAFHEYIGGSGSSLFDQSGGTNTLLYSDAPVGGMLVVTGDSTYLLRNGTLSAGTEIIGRGVGTFTQSGGINTVTENLCLADWSGSTGTYNLNGGTLVVPAITVGEGTATFNFGGGTLQAGAAFAASLPINLTGTGGNAKVDTAGYAVELSGPLSGSGGLTKLGANTLTLSGNNVYEGPTTVQAGTLNVANTSGSATGTGAVTVESGAKLIGSGRIEGPVTVAGTLAPGNSPGVLTVDNSVTFQESSVFQIEVNGLEAGTGYDQLVASGPVQLDGLLDVSFGTFTATGNDLLFVIDNVGAEATTGTFQYADDGLVGTSNGYNWYITYDADNGASANLNGGNDVALYSSVVPEPSTLALMGMGAASLLACFWRRRRRKPALETVEDDWSFDL